MLSIFPIPAFNDNYIWALYRPKGACVIVDPGDAAPVQRFLDEHELTLSALLITHHHADHTGGIDALLAQHNVPVYGPAKESIPAITHPLNDGDTVALPDGLPTCQVIDVPGHTLGHIAYFVASMEPPVLFPGDTLFAGGCGRIFEGTAEQMLASLDRLASLPAATRVCCAHEYTQNNLTFALAVEPNNPALHERIRAVKALREQQRPSLPSQLADELSSNPFLRVDQPQVRQALTGLDASATRSDYFAALRRWKDNF